MKERTQVKEKNLMINILEVSEVGFIEMKINVCSSESAVALVHFVPIDASMLIEL